VFACRTPLPSHADRTASEPGLRSRTDCIANRPPADPGFHGHTAYRPATVRTYEPVPGGEYTLELRPDTEDNDGDVVAAFDVRVEGGRAYSTFATGYLDPSGEQPAFDLLAAVDGRTGSGDG
jgi:hypothetical protein